MNLSRFFFRQTVNNISRLNSRALSPYAHSHRDASTITTPFSPPLHSPNSRMSDSLQYPKYQKPFWFFTRHSHSARETDLKGSASDVELDSDDSEEDETMNEFLSRFVWIMRGKLSEVYTDCDKKTIDGMLLVIVGKVVSEMEKGGLEQMLGTAATTPSDDFSEDLWRTVWEVSNMVLEDMEKARKKEKMKTFLQADEVKEMCKFAGEAGIRGDMLRELRFKWAREKLEESEFYQSLERLRVEEAQAQEAEKSETVSEETFESDLVMMAEEPKVVSLPKRHGKIKYKIYGLDLSDSKWAEVADKIHDTGEIIWPQEAKPISGKCRIVTEKILSLQEDDDVSPLLAEWIELLKPNRIDWIALLDRLKEHNTRLYYKVAELVLGEESFQANTRDYSKLIDGHAKENRFEDSERILKKMNENGIVPDILTLSILVQMYVKAGNLERAKESFENLKSHGFKPDMNVYNSMIMAYVNAASQPKIGNERMRELAKAGETLMREIEAMQMKPSKEIYMALLGSFAQCGEINGAQRIFTTMQFGGFAASLDSYTLLIEAYAKNGDPDQARSHFDYMIGMGIKPDDRCTASMIAAYEKNNMLDKALDLLLKLEKDGFEPGVATYSVLVDWLGQLQLIDEAEQLLGKIGQMGEAPPLNVHISLCCMYAKAANQKKTLQALGVIENKKEELGQKEFERVIKSLIDGGFAEDAKRVQGLMKSEGFEESEQLRVAIMASDTLGRIRRPTTMRQ